MNKLFIIILIVLALFFLCALISARAQGDSGTAKPTAKIQAEDTVIKHPAEETESEHSHPEGSHPEGSHKEEGGAHISGEHEKFELFHAEYYSMPWRSVRTQNDLWILMFFLVSVNILLLLLINIKMRRKYK